MEMEELGFQALFTAGALVACSAAVIIQSIALWELWKNRGDPILDRRGWAYTLNMLVLVIGIVTLAMFAWGYGKSLIEGRRPSPLVEGVDFFRGGAPVLFGLFAWYAAQLIKPSLGQMLARIDRDLNGNNGGASRADCRSPGGDPGGRGTGGRSPGPESVSQGGGGRS